MSVDGREISSLDFASLIGAPLNAIVEAQAKSAIATANFIREVAFDREGRAVISEFRYTRVGEDGRAQEVCLGVPFITMLPIPYVAIEHAEIEFNARITSTRESSSSGSFGGELEAGIDGAWFKGASVSTKMSYQKQSGSQEREQRSFDMRVLVRLRSAEMPPGTERLLSALEGALDERRGGVRAITGTITRIGAERTAFHASGVAGLAARWQLTVAGATYTVTEVERETGRVTIDAPLDPTIVDGDPFEARP
jgi:hypothetical protein